MANLVLPSIRALFAVRTISREPFWKQEYGAPYRNNSTSLMLHNFMTHIFTTDLMVRLLALRILMNDITVKFLLSLQHRVILRDIPGSRLLQVYVDIKYAAIH